MLVLAVGKATKLLPLLSPARKQYIFELVAGEKTDTGDGSGVVTARAEVAKGWAGELGAVAASLIGPLTQIPPMHSAVKIDGRPLYRAARRGLDLPRAARLIHIHALRVISIGTTTARLFVECDAGTYVRVLCEELGRRLGVPARMGALLRVGAGPFHLRDSVTPQQIATQPDLCITDPLTVLDQPRMEIDDRSASRFIHGNEVWLKPPASASRALTASPTDSPLEVLVTHNGALIGCGHRSIRDGTTVVAPTRVVADAAFPSAGAQGSDAGGANG